MTFILVLSKIYPKEGCEEKLIDLAGDLVKYSLNDEGNISFEFLSSLDDDTFVFIEKWENMQALSNHISTVHFKFFELFSADLIADKDVEVIDSSKIDLYE